MEATASLEEAKDFLHRSWQSLMSSERLLYNPFGNTAAVDLFFNLDLGEDLDVLLLGAGDIRNIVKTVHGLTNPEHSKQTVKKLHFVVNDIDADILARDLLLLEIIHSVDVGKEEDFEYLWAVWYNLALSPRHHQRLTTLINRLSEGNFGNKHVWDFCDNNTKKGVHKSFQGWAKCNVSLDEAQKRRHSITKLTPIDAETVDYASKKLQGNRLAAIYGLFSQSIAKNIHRYEPWTDVYDSCREVLPYYAHGSADPNYGIPGKSWPSDRSDWLTNPTLLKTHTTEYLADLSASPFTSYLPLEKTALEQHKRLGKACFELMKMYITSYRKLTDEKKLQLKIVFLVGDAALLLTSDVLKKNYDLIDTSSLADHMEILPLLLLCQPYLKGKDSVLRIESLSWQSRSLTIKEYLDDELLHLDPLLYPTVLGLRLAETFEYGRRDAPTWAEIHSSVLAQRETLLWTKTTSTKATPLSLKASTEIVNFLLGYAKRVFTDKTSPIRQRDPFVLLKLLESMAPLFVGGMETLLDLVNPLVTPESEWMFQWEVYLAVFGYNPQPEHVVFMKACVKKLNMPFGVMESSYCAFKFKCVLVANTVLELVVLEKHQKRMDKSVKLYFPETVGEIVVDGNIKVASRTDLIKPLTPPEPTLSEGICVEEHQVNYIVTLAKGQKLTGSTFRVDSDTLEIDLPGIPQPLLILFSCPVEKCELGEKDDVAQITVLKKRDATMGEEILPLCKIKLTKLEPTSVDRCDFATNTQIAHRVNLLQRHTAPLDAVEMNLGELLTGEDLLAYFRCKVLHFVCGVDREPLLNLGDLLHILFARFYWYNDAFLVEVYYGDVEQLMDIMQVFPVPNTMTIIKPFSKGLVELLQKLLHRNALQVDQRNVARGVTKSFLQLHFPRSNLRQQVVNEELHPELIPKPEDCIPKDVCVKCGKKGEMKACGGCRIVRYCSKECQKTDYKNHKEYCKRADADSTPKAKALCGYCNRKDCVPEHVCTRCYKANYCSLQCRYADLPTHRKNCEEPEIEKSAARSVVERKNDDGASGVSASPASTCASASSLAASAASNPCSCCGLEIEASKRRVCSKCREAVYCSELCEQADWPQHYERCLELSLADVASCGACQHTMTRCPRCKKVWFCNGCKDDFQNHQC